jgi:anti-sigma regulatory factor (Ser/Thr protein kinase)
MSEVCVASARRRFLCACAWAGTPDPTGGVETVEHCESQLPATKTAPQLVRAFLRSTLETWKLDGFGDITELLASELVSNVVVHVGHPMTIRIARRPDGIRVEVQDSSQQLPVLETPDPTSEHGRGVFLVDALASDWGTDVHPEDGKTIWFELDTTTATIEAHGDDSALVVDPASETDKLE